MYLNSEVGIGIWCWSDSGEPLWRPLLHNESCPDALPMVKSIAPPNHIRFAPDRPRCVNSSRGGIVLVRTKNPLCCCTKRIGFCGFFMEGLGLQILTMLWWHHLIGFITIEFCTARRFMFVSQFWPLFSVLQVGYDPEVDSYPSWLVSQPYYHLLPSVVAPGTPISSFKGGNWK